MEYNKSIENKEKNQVTYWSVIAAIFLTSIKLIIGLTTNSLGILSEAAHSGLDLIAALMTYYAVRFSSKPADEDHNFGHGKIENFSALFETVLLLITCGWIIWEVVKRLTGEGVNITVNKWSFIVIISSIIIDISRSRALKKVAVKYNSQAIEADALHFSTDVYSSAVVFLGLIGVYFNFNYADSIAAFFVALIVIFISFNLGKRAIDVLLDKAPKGIKEKIEEITSQIPDVIKAHDIRIRSAGAQTLVEMNIHVNETLTVDKAHEISHEVEQKLHQHFNNLDVHIHIEPEKEN
ncbi:MAG: cation diffusion facilitator family transporter [Ignavibacteriaceae bacterium]